MSEISSITVDQPFPRNDGQNGIGRGRQMNPFAYPYMRPLSPPTARRILVLPHQTNIVKVLSTMSRIHHQAMYILSGTGYVSSATLLSLPSREQLDCIGRGNILYLNGWFQPMIRNRVEAMPTNCSNGILHVSLSGVPQGVGIACSLVAFGTVAVDVMFVCGPGSVVQPDAPGGGPREPIRVRVMVRAQQAPMAE